MFDLFNKNKKRKEAMTKVAARLGMSYTTKDEYGTKTLLGDFKLFQSGVSKSITHFLHKKEEEQDIDTYIFDYRYVVNTGNSAIPFTQTVFFIQSKELDLPLFFMRPENFLQRIGTYLGMQDIDFESHPEFSGQYLLQGEEESLIRKKLDGDFRSFFTIEKDWNLEGLNYFLIFYRRNKILPPEEIFNFYSKGKEIYRLLNK